MNLPLISPALVLAFLVATIYGFIFFLLFGSGRARLILYWFVAVAGFGAGQGIASAIGLRLLNIGDVHLIEGTLASALALFGARAGLAR